MKLLRLLPLLLALVLFFAPSYALAQAAPHPFFQELERPDSPNSWLIAPEGFPGAPDETAPVFPVPAGRLEELFLSVARGEGAGPPTRREEGFLCLVAQTPLLGFEDDVCVQFIPLGTESATLALYSASRVGYWDLGANRSRLRDWLAALRGEVAGN